MFLENLGHDVGGKKCLCSAEVVQAISGLSNG